MYPRAGTGRGRVHRGLSARLPAAAGAGGRGPAAGASPGPEERAAGASSEPGLGRVGVGLEHPAPGRVADGDRAGALPAPVASGAGHQAMEIHRPYRSSPRPCAGSALADLYLHGKLLYAWVLEKWARRRCGDDWNRLDGPRRATPWRVWKLLRQELATAISGVRHWNLDRWPACLAVMQERPRRRPLQTLPERVNGLIAQCRASGMSSV